MGDRRRSLAIVTACSAVALTLVSCGDPNNATSPAAAGSSLPAPPPATAPTPVPTGSVTAPTAAALPASTGSAVADVSCGPITAANGQKLEIVAKGSAAGVAGCSEAIDVLTEYFQRGDETEGTAHELTVRDWQCSTIDNGVTTAVITGCDKDGLSIQAVNS